MHLCVRLDTERRRKISWASHATCGLSEYRPTCTWTQRRAWRRSRTTVARTTSAISWCRRTRRVRSLKYDSFAFSFGFWERTANIFEAKTNYFVASEERIVQESWRWQCRVWWKATMYEEDCQEHDDEDDDDQKLWRFGILYDTPRTIYLL